MIDAKSIGKKLAHLRKQKGFSQQDIATSLNISRSSVTQMEAGKRNITVPEFAKLAEILQFSLDEFIYEQNETPPDLPEEKKVSPQQKQQLRISVPELNLEKFKTILLYIIKRCAGKPNVGETLLYKLLYFSDFNYYELYEEHLSGAEYRKLPYGPVPHNIKKEVIDRVIDQFSDWSAKAISEYSHKDIPWMATKDKEPIDYELVFYRTPPYSVRSYLNEEEEKD